MAVAVERGRDDGGVGETETAVFEKPAIGVVGRIDVERELEPVAGDVGELGEAAKLVDSQPVAAAAVLDRRVSASPRCDRAEGERFGRRRRDGHSSSTTGCRVVSQRSPQVGIRHSGLPIRSPIVT